MIFSVFRGKKGFLGILGILGIGATIRSGREMLCLPYAGLFCYLIVCCLTLDLHKLQVVFVKLSAAQYKISHSSMLYFWNRPVVLIF